MILPTIEIRDAEGKLVGAIPNGTTMDAPPAPEAPAERGPVERLVEETLGFYDWVMRATSFDAMTPDYGNKELSVALAGVYFQEGLGEALLRQAEERTALDASASNDRDAAAA